MPLRKTKQGSRIESNGDGEGCFDRVVREDGIPKEITFEQRQEWSDRVSHSAISGGRDFKAEEGRLQSESEVACPGKLEARAAVKKGQGWLERFSRVSEIRRAWSGSVRPWFSLLFSLFFSPFHSQCPFSLFPWAHLKAEASRAKRHFFGESLRWFWLPPNQDHCQKYSKRQENTYVWTNLTEGPSLTNNVRLGLT